MRLSRLRLERYGPFEHLDLRFDAEPGRVNLIVAPNGYGKSVIRRSIAAFLFGIENRTPMTFRFGTERMRILADVVHDGDTRSMVRRKGNGNTLAAEGSADILPDEARRLLGGADETVFHQLFGLDTALLRAGGRDLIHSQGRLGQVLFAAGGGMGRVRDMLSELERKRDELGKAARHRSRPLWSALSHWEQAGLDLRKSALRPDGWHTLERQAAETAQTLDALLRAQADDVRERDRLRTIGACRPWLQRVHAAALVLADAGDAPELDGGFEQRWRDALQHGVVSAGNADAAGQALQAARIAREELTFDPAWIAAQADIQALADLRGVAAQCEYDLPPMERALAAEQVKATLLRRDLGWDAAPALPGPSIIKNAQRRVRLHPKLVADANAASDALAAADRTLMALTADLTALPTQSNSAAVADLAGLLRAEGDPAARLDNVRRNLREAETALRMALATIPDCPLAEDALVRTAAPSEPRLDAVGKALSEAEAAQAQAVRDHAACVADLDRAQSKLRQLEQTAMLPAPDALAEARTRRDTVWGQLCASEHRDPATVVALERAMRQADAIADALIAHSEEAAVANTLRANLVAMEIERAKQASNVTRTSTAAAEARAVLLAIARTAGGDTDDLSGLRSFLRAREAAVVCLTARDAAAAELADLEKALETLGSQLAAALNAPARDLAALGVLLAEADRAVDAERHLAATRKSLIDQIDRQRSARVAAAVTAESTERALEEWNSTWLKVTAELVRPSDEAPAIAADALAQMEDLRKAEAEIADKQGRVDAMRAAIDLLALKVGRLSALAPTLASLPAIDAAEGFRQRLQAELQQAARCQDADHRIAQDETRLSLAVGEADLAARTLDGLRAALRVETNDAAERQLQRTRAVAAARAESAEAQRQLAIQGGGLSLEAIMVRAGETTAEADIARISEIDTSHRARLPLIEAAREASQTAAAALEKAGSGMDAAEAAQRREAAQAALARTAEEALMLHATHALLQAALDRQASGASQPLLSRIGDVFRTITAGTHAGVRIEETKEGQTMVALEADGVTRKALDQLSEGTSDQLYLALRIAALEDYATSTSPLPFIADDVLQTFDDPRTAATMRALLELSEQVQVIVLTHHTHVGDLAAQLPAGAVHVMRLKDDALV